MNNFKLVKINSGSAIHLAEHFESISGVQGFNVYCGSGKTGFRNILRKVNKEVNTINITCKKCLKRYHELQKEIKIDDELSLKDYCDKHGNTVLIPK